MTENRPVPWWKTAVVYQIYPRSFADGNADGIGDLTGARAKLPYLAELGIDAVWFSPIFPSPMADFGYDVSDYCDVDPVFGSLADFDDFLDEAHRLDIRVILDWVGNHTSKMHPWFVESRSSRSSAKRDWYIWRDALPDGSPPNNWVSEFTGGAPAWTLDPDTNQYYLHLFLPDQPDLNWANPEVQEAMHETLRFWMRRGVDGFRFDVAHLIGKNPALPDDPPETSGLSHVPFHDNPEVHPLLAGIRRVLEEFPGERMMIGEVVLLSTSLIPPYYGSLESPELHMSFNFPPLWAPWEAEVFRKRISQVEKHFAKPPTWPSWVLSNHDVVRHRTRYASEARARAAAVLILTLRGTPFLYAGEELGLEDAVVAPERVVDPGGRDGCRAPLPWTNEAPDHGWSNPWLPLPANAQTHSAAAEIGDPGSMHSLYRRLLELRHSSPVLQTGSFAWLEAQAGVLAYRRALGGTTLDVYVNFTDDTIDLGTGKPVVLSSVASPHVMLLAPNEARIVR